MSLEQIKEATATDPILSKVAQLVQSGEWQSVNNNEELKPYANVRDELSVGAEANIILRGTKIVLPRSLIKQAVDILQ